MWRLRLPLPAAVPALACLRMPAAYVCEVACPIPLALCALACLRRYADIGADRLRHTIVVCLCLLPALVSVRIFSVCVCLRQCLLLPLPAPDSLPRICLPACLCLSLLPSVACSPLSATSLSSLSAIALPVTCLLVRRDMPGRGILRKDFRRKGPSTRREYAGLHPCYRLCPAEHVRVGAGVSPSRGLRPSASVRPGSPQIT